MCVIGGQLLFFCILIFVHTGFEFSSNFIGQYFNWPDTYSEMQWQQTWYSSSKLVVGSWRCLKSSTYEDEDFEDNKGVIRIRKPNKTANTMTKKKKDKRTNNDLQNITYKTKDRVTWTPLKTGGELMCFGRVGSSCSTRDTRHVTQVIK